MPLSESELRDLLGQVRVERHHHLYIIQSLGDAVALAGEQVQDMRLDELERPVAPPDSNLLVELILGCMIPGVVSAALDPILKRVGRVLAVRAAADVVAKVPDMPTRYVNQSTQLRMLWKEIAEPPKPKAAVVSEYFSPEALSFWRDIGKDSTALLLPRAMPARPIFAPPRDHSAAVPLNTTLWPTVVAPDTSTTAIRRAALHFQRYQEAMTATYFDELEYRLASGTMSDDEIAFVRGILRKAAETAQLGDTRLFDGFSRYAEGCIWRLMYGRITTPHFAASVLRGVYPADRLRVPIRLFNYWIMRLPHPEGDGFAPFAHKVFANRRPKNDKPIVEVTGDVPVNPVFGQIPLLQNEWAPRQLVEYFENMTAPLQIFERRLRALTPATKSYVPKRIMGPVPPAGSQAPSTPAS